MAELSVHALEFLRCFNRAVRSLKMYKASHPQVQRDCDAAFAVLGSMLAEQESVVIGATGGVLYVQGRAVKEESPALKTFSDLLRDKNIASFQAKRGATREEFIELATILFMDPEDALKDDHIKPELLSPLRNFRINEEGLGPPAAPAPAPVAESTAALAEAWMKTREDPVAALDALLLEMKADDSVESVVRFFGKAGAELARMEPAEASRRARQCLEQVAIERFAPRGVAELRSSLMKTVLAMSPELRRMAFGEALDDAALLDVSRLLLRLSPAVRSAALAADLAGGRTDPERIRSLLEALAPTPDEYVALCESAAARIAETPAAAGGFSRLFKALKVAARIPLEKLRGKILILDPEAFAEEGYANALAEAGYTIIRHGDGQEAYAELSSRNDLHCLAMDIKVPGLSGLEILTRLQDARRALPVIVVSETAGFREAFEVASYPRLKYFVKPIDAAELLAAVEDVMPVPPRAKTEVISAAELARARDVQARMSPAATPSIDGYDAAFRCAPAAGLGGDFLDVFPLPGGRIALAIAKVSSRDLAGTMVMLMFRTVLRTLAARRATPKEALVEANQVLARDMPKGILVSAALAFFDPAAHALAIADAGHPAPLVWAKDFGMASFLMAGRSPLGTAPGAEFEASVTEDTVQLAPRDRLLLYTHGAVTARDAKGAPFTEKRFLKLVNFGGEKSSSELVEAVLKEIEVHRAGQTPGEDVTVLCLTRNA